MNISLEIAYQVIIKILDLIKDLVIVFGGGIALLNYVSQSKQKKIDNAFAIVRNFQQSISKDEIEIWKQVFLNSTEMASAEPEMFVLFDGDRIVQNMISDLFLAEGSGFYVEKLSLNLSEPKADIDLSCVRRIAEELEIIGYEILNGQIEFRIIYYELGQIMKCTYILLEKSQGGLARNRERFGNFIRVCEKFNILEEQIPCKGILPAD